MQRPWMGPHGGAGRDGRICSTEWVLRRYGYPEAAVEPCTTCFACVSVVIGAYRYHLDLRDEAITPASGG